VCDKTWIFCFFPIINKYLCMAKRSLLSERPSYNVTSVLQTEVTLYIVQPATPFHWMYNVMMAC